MTKSWLTPLLAASLAALLAGCGSSDDNTATPTEPTSSDSSWDGESWDNFNWS